MEEPKDSSNDPSTPHPTEGSPEEQPGPSSSGGRKGRRRGPKDRSKEKASPEVLKALKRMRESFDNHRRAFPFLDASSCWDPDEFSRENQRLLALGYKGSQLVDKLCTWAAGGRLAILLTDRETYLLVRTFDKEERLITHHLHPFSRGCGFQCTMMNAKMPEEIAKEREKLSRQRTYAERASDESSDDKEHRSDREEGSSSSSSSSSEEEAVWPFKEESFIRRYRNSPYARRFDTRTFDPSPEFYVAAEEDPKGAKARTYNSYCGLRWSPEGARRVYQGWNPEQREEADRRARIIMDHIRSEVCQEDREMIDYLLRWILSLVVQPERRMLTMLVFVGPSGCGKSVLVQNVIGPLFGNHYCYNSDLNDLLGKFNAMAGDTILAYADEARVTAGTRAAAILKTVITEGTGSLRMELKGRDTTYVDSFLNLIGAVENMTEFQVEIESRRYVPFPFAGNKRGEKEYFARLVSAAVDDKRMGLLAFLVHLLDTVDLTGFDRGQVLPRAKDQALKEIMGSFELGARDPFREWVRKWVDRGWIVPRNEMDDTDVTRNEHIHWIDSQGRTWATRRHPWIPEIQSEVLYARFHKDMGLTRLSGAQIKAGLERGGFLRPECCGPVPVRRRPWCMVGGSGGEISFVQLRKTYLALFRCEDYERMLGIGSDVEIQQDMDPDEGSSDVTLGVPELIPSSTENEEEGPSSYDMTPEQDAEFNRLFAIQAAHEEEEEQKQLLAAKTAIPSSARDKGKEKEQVREMEKEKDKGKEKEKDDHEESQKTFPSNEKLMPDAPVWPPETIYDEAYAAALQEAEFQRSQEFVSRQQQVLPESGRKEKRLRTERLLSHRPLEALEGVAEPGDGQQVSLRRRKRHKKSHRRASEKRLLGRLMDALRFLSEEDDDEKDRSDSSDSDSEDSAVTGTTEAD